MGMEQLLETLGETNEFGAGRITVPASKYPVRLTVVGDPDVTDKGSPFIVLAGNVLEGPFAGNDVQARYSLSLGGTTATGGVIGLLNGACKAITGKPPLVAGVVPEAWKFPERGDFPPGREGDIAFGKATRLAFKEYINEFPPDQKLAFMLKYLRVAEWEGKAAVAVVDVEPNKDGTRFYNRWSGFYAMTDAKHGLEFCRRVAFAEQAVEKAKMEAGA